MSPEIAGPRTARRSVAVILLLVGIGVVAGLPVGDVAACSPIPRPRVYVDELSTVLDPDGAWADDYAETDGPATPTVTGAYRIEVVEETPETEESFAGAVWQQTDVWGAADVEPAPDVQGPVRKGEGNTCQGNEPPLGTVIYYLSTDDGIPLYINDVDDEREVEAALDDVFGPSLAVPDGVEAGTTATTTRTDTTDTTDTTATADSGSSAGVRWVVVAAIGVVLLVAAAGIIWLGRRRRRVPQ